MIDAILFDFGQTLVNSADGFRAAERDAQRKLIMALGDMPWDQFIDCYRDTRKRLHDQSRISRVDLWRAVYAAFEREPDLAQLVSWEGEYWQTVNRYTAPFPEAVAVLEQLQPRYGLGLVSNTQGQVNDAGHRLHEFPELARFFGVAIFAGEGGIPAKPDPKPFQLCLERVGVKPQAAVYVGDDLRIDVGGARGVGMQPVWLKHHTVTRNWPARESEVPVITSLEELLDLAGVLAPQQGLQIRR
ncbi:MAG: HAD family hydrolase [Acidiferrobacterales bacterium]|nr:HAD family hydrolase [Acidiferrobacterales bacterium]